MIPSTISGIIILVCFILPGAVFSAAQESKNAIRKHSPLREMSIYLTAAVAAYLASLVVFMTSVAIIPELRSGAAAATEGFTSFRSLTDAQVTALLASLVISACVFAFLMGKAKFGKFIAGDDGGSSWWVIFRAAPSENSEAWVTLRLTDNTVLSGYLYSWSRSADDSAERDVVLSAPLWEQLPDRSRIDKLDDSLIAVNASSIKYMGVVYHDAF